MNTCSHICVRDIIHGRVELRQNSMPVVCGSCSSAGSYGGSSGGGRCEGDNCF